MIDHEKIARQIAEWERDPASLAEWARRTAMKMALALEQIVDQASGPRAAQDIAMAADRLTRLLSAMAAGGLLQGRREIKLLPGPDALPDGDSKPPDS